MTVKYEKITLFDEFLVLLGRTISRYFACSNEEKEYTKTKGACTCLISMLSARRNKLVRFVGERSHPRHRVTRLSFVVENFAFLIWQLFGLFFQKMAIFSNHLVTARHLFGTATVKHVPLSWAI